MIQRINDQIELLFAEKGDFCKLSNKPFDIGNLQTRIGSCVSQVERINKFLEPLELEYTLKTLKPKS